MTLRYTLLPLFAYLLTSRLLAQGGIDNDDCETAITITCGSSTAGNTTDAQADDAPECGTPVSAPGVWYTFTGVTGTVVLSTCADHGYDTKINVYTGACDDLECVTGNDDGPFGCYPGSEVIMEADEATVYYVLVQGYNGETGSFTLSMECPACAPPTGMTVTPTDVLAYLDWVPANPNGDFAVEYGPAGFFPGTGTVISGTVGVDGPPVTIPGLELATDYDAYLMETCEGGELGFPRGPISFTTLAEALPVNAFCAGALAIACGEDLAGNTELALVADAPDCGSAYIDTPGLWYTFTGDGNDVTLSVCDAADFDTKISVWSGTCSDLVCEGGVDDEAGCPGNTSAVTVATTAGTVYYAMVHGYDGETGTFTLTMSCAEPCAPAVPNDDCSTAQVIAPQPIGGCVPVQGTNLCSYSSAEENPPCESYSAAFDVWYVFNTGPSADHTITVATITSDLLGVALYNACGTGGFIECYDPQAGPIVLTGLDLYDDYYVQIWNAGGADAGTFTICVEAPIIDAIGERSNTSVLRAWPVPADDLLTVDGITASSRIQLLDAQGRTVLALRAERTGQQVLDVSALAPGAYVLRMEGEVMRTLPVVLR